MRMDFTRNTTYRETSHVVVTWQGYMSAHVTDGYDESMQTTAFSLSIELGEDYGMI